MKNKIKWSRSLSVAVLLAVFVSGMSFLSMADEGKAENSTTEVRSGWIDEHLGPGVARWVDGDGNVNDEPGKKEEGQAGGSGSGIENGQAENAGSVPAENGQTENGAGESTASQQPATEEQGEAATAIPAGRVIDPSRPMIALTFDDGPYAPVGNQIMDCLSQYGGKATFFVVGNRVASYSREMKRMVSEGHEIGNHTYEHKYLTKLNGSQIQSQIARCNSAIEAVTGVRPTLVRLPGGMKNATVLANIREPIIMWSIDTNDWKTRNTRKIVDSVLGKVRDGDIVLMHELYSQTGAAALEIIPALTQAGYQLVTVSEMAQYRGGLALDRVYSRFYP